MKQNRMRAIKLLGILTVALLSFSCKKDNEKPVLDAPTISFAGEERIDVKRGEPISVTLNLEADGGNKELLVFRGGGLLDQVPLNNTASAYTYTNQTVPSDAMEGEELEYEFALVNTQDAQSERVTLTVVTVAYDEITVGGETLYEVEIPADGVVESGESIKLIKGRNYYLASTLVFQDGASLAIEEGVHVYLKADGSNLVSIEITAGADIEIAGTATDPVVITSEKTLTGDAAPDDWGTLTLRGNSGSIKYLRLEYGGARNLRLNAAGSGITIEYVQVFKAQREALMITDGDTNLKYVVITDNADGSSVRIGEAYSGNIQFAIVTASPEAVGGNERDEFDIRETSSPRIANLTLTGPGVGEPNTHGMRIRSSSSGKIYNTIVADFRRRGVRLNDNVVVTDLNGPTVFAYSYVFNVRTDPYRDDTDHGNPFRGYLDEAGNLQNPFHNNVTGFDDGSPILATIAGIGVDSFIPEAAQASAFDPASLGSFFTSAPYVGAIQDEANDWTRGWVKNADGSLR